jgi:hypothetical protein
VKLEIGEVNKTALLIIGLMILGGLGYAFYSMAYKPATNDRALAQGEFATAEAAQTDAQAKLDQAKDARERKEAGLDKTAVGKIMAKRNAVPKDPAIEEVMLEVNRLALKSGVDVTKIEPGETGGNAGPVSVTTAGGTLTTDITIEGHARYSSLMMFARRMQDLVSVRRGKVYVRGRLISIVDMSIITPDTQTFGTEAMPEGHQQVTMIIRVWSETDGQQATGGAAPTGTATTTDPNAAANGATTPTGPGGASDTAGATNSTGTTSTTPTTGTNTTTNPTSSTTNAAPAGTPAGTPAPTAGTGSG